ncbi:MAG: hypothetical protein Q9220_002465 [cf. Caloplaca sp. 1 TL-2023]
MDQANPPGILHLSTFLPDHEHEPRLSAMQPQELVETASKAHDLLVNSSTPRPHTVERIPLPDRQSETVDQDDDEDLYLATPRASSQQVKPDLIRSSLQPQLACTLGATGHELPLKASPGRLGRTMLPSDNDQPSHYPVVAISQAKHASDARVAAGTGAQATARSEDLKRKARQHSASRSSKRPKTDARSAVEHDRSSESNRAHDVNVAKGEFALPVTPPRPKGSSSRMEPRTVPRGRPTNPNGEQNPARTAREGSTAAQYIKPKASLATKDMEGDQNGLSITVNQHHGTRLSGVCEGTPEQSDAVSQLSARKTADVNWQTATRADTAEIKRPISTNRKEMPADNIPSIVARRAESVQAAASVAERQLRMLKYTDIDENEVSRDSVSSMALALSTTAGALEIPELQTVQRRTTAPSESSVMPVQINPCPDTVMPNENEEAETMAVQLEDQVVLQSPPNREDGSRLLEAVGVGLGRPAGEDGRGSDITQEAMDKEDDPSGSQATFSKPVTPAHLAAQLYGALSGVLSVVHLQRKSVPTMPTALELKTKRHSRTGVNLKTLFENRSSLTLSNNPTATSHRSELIGAPKSPSPKPTPLHLQSRPNTTHRITIFKPEQGLDKHKSSRTHASVSNNKANGKKRVSSAVPRTPIKKSKQKPQSKMTGEAHTIRSVTRREKDPDRLPQLISFSAKGPRNQGLRSSDRKRVLHVPAQDNQDLAGTRKVWQKLEERATNANEGRSDTILTPQDRRDSNIATPGRSQRKKAISGDRVAWETSRVVQPEPHQDRDVLSTEDKLVFPGPGVIASSQSSKVDENGSPLSHPQATRIQVNIAPQGQAEKMAVCLEDITLGYLEIQEPPQNRPQEPEELARHHEKAHCIQNRSGKHRLSSPDARSNVLDTVELHAFEPNGRLVNVVTETVVKSAMPQDPFTSRKTERPTSFLKMLRRVSRRSGSTKEQSPKYTGAQKTHTSQLSVPSFDNLDQTPEGDYTRESRQRKQVY